MKSDEIKILSHLSLRKGWIRRQEIEKAWSFVDFESAVEALIEKNFIKSMSVSYRITGKGVKALKEVK